MSIEPFALDSCVDDMLAEVKYDNIAAVLRHRERIKLMYTTNRS